MKEKERVNSAPETWKKESGARKARTNHKCTHCKKKIPKGTTYYRLVSDGLGMGKFPPYAGAYCKLECVNNAESQAEFETHSRT